MFLRFFQDRRANVLPLFSIAMVPVIGFMGAAVDYSRMLATRTAMQNALDATALYMSKEVGLAPFTAAQITEKADNYFRAQFNRPEAKALAIAASLASNAGMFTLKMSASAKVDMTFARVIGQTEVPIGSSSEVVWGFKRLEIALALDNTGSMSSSSKMTELKKAAKGLIDTLKAAAKRPEDVKIAIVPFDTTVHLGTAYKDAEWIDYSTLGTWQYSQYYGWQWVQGNKNTWEGCLMDRKQEFDVSDTVPTTANADTFFAAADCGGSLTKILPLTNDWTAMTTKIDAMTPNGNTNVTIGLVWGWHALTGGVPLTEATAPAPDLEKVIILLTDGDNTQNRFTSNSAQIDARTKKVCQNVKNAGIRLYTIRVINGNAALLSECATTPGMYFNVQQASQLNTVFSTIAQNLANLRIVK
jgi:Mg-chelatase subunit ChlD